MPLMRGVTLEKAPIQVGVPEAIPQQGFVHKHSQEKQEGAWAAEQREGEAK